jgi:hypothetical protein
MKNAPGKKTDPEMLSDYDFSKGVRGKYAKRYAAGTNVVVLAPDVATAFPDADSVNEALRALMKIARKNSKKATASAASRNA